MPRSAGSADMAAPAVGIPADRVPRTRPEIEILLLVHLRDEARSQEQSVRVEGGDCTSEHGRFSFWAGRGPQNLGERNRGEGGGRLTPYRPAVAKFRAYGLLREP